MDRRLAGIGCGLLAALIWGGFPVMTRLGVARSALDAYDVTFLRFAVSGLLLLPVLLRRGLGGLGAGPVALMVAGIGAPYMLVIAAGLTRAPVGLFAALTPGSMIAFSAMLSALAVGEPSSRRRRAGILLILAGIVVTGSADLGGSGSSAVALFLLGGLLWAVYTVTTRVFAVEPLRATAIVSVVSAALYAPPYLAVRGGALLAMPLAEVAAQAVYQGVLVSVVALYFYSKGVALLGPTVGASFAALVPVLAVLEGSLLLGEAPPAASLAGLVVVTLGMATILAGPRPEPRPS
ncbi:DMT family transporter [uncultured Methylobacterium sp.]|jgi:drug/metabolite transporter (DMT)-like permease|uniref:DMT family transporter n=1 Tax=uncultured Methylobacterium sp. TaxID=157278 RepID=UPI00262730F3|nr:DMT family transporter [uncultured Methylobacterium sp.]